MPSQKDIAERAHVSQMTMSLALRDSPVISELTRRRIRAIAEELDYRPDPLVSALMRQRRKKMRKGPRAKLRSCTTILRIRRGGLARSMPQVVLTVPKRLRHNVDTF